LLLLAGLVDDERGTLGLLLGHLLGLDGGGELGREGEVLSRMKPLANVPSLGPLKINQVRSMLTVSETSSSKILNLAARRDKFSLTSFATISRCVISWLALNCATTLLSTSLTMDGSTRSS
jgi:hypothetical protein